MKGNIGKLGMLLTVFLLVGSVFVGGVMAQPDKNSVKSNNDIVIKGKEVKEDIDESYAIGKGNTEPVINSPLGNGISILGTKLWSASTDLYNYYPLSTAPRLKTYSKSRDGNSPWDIDKIKVRGRVWKNNNNIFDDTDTQYNNADASIYWKSGCTYCGGSYFARGNHAFEERGYQSWYPITEDSLNV